MDIAGIAGALAAGAESVFAAGIAIPSIFWGGIGVGDAAVGLGCGAGGRLVGVAGLACSFAAGFAAGFFLGAGIGIAIPFMSISCIDCADVAPAKASVVPTASAAKTVRFMPRLRVGAR
jgi:hypothetical protein